MIEAALIIAFAIIVSTKLRLSHGLKPRKALAQITVAGQTQRGEESFQLTGTIFDDESVEEADAKITKICEIRERRVAFCNARLAEITDNPEELLEEAKKVIEEAGLKVVE